MIDFDSIKKDIIEVQSIAQKRIEEIKENIRLQTASTKYVVDCVWSTLGVYCIDYIDSQYKTTKRNQGAVFDKESDAKKVLKKRDKYDKAFFDKNGKLLFIDGCYYKTKEKYQYYYFERGDYFYYLYARDERFYYNGYITNLRGKMQNGKLVEWSEIGGIGSVWTKIYTHNEKEVTAETYNNVLSKTGEALCRDKFELVNGVVSNMVRVSTWI